MNGTHENPPLTPPTEPATGPAPEGDPAHGKVPVETPKNPCEGELVMRTIYKYRLNMNGGMPFTVDMPMGAEIRHVAMQGDVPHLWAEVGSDNPTETRTFMIAGTGQALPPAVGDYVGTMHDGPYVWHLLEL